jgi:replicative DNA helicase
MIDMETLRVPPHSIDSEQSVLGGLMLDHRALAKVVDWLKEDDFYRKDHRVIYRAIRELIEKGKPADAVTLGEWFEENNLAELVGGVGYTIQLANATPSAANITAYAEIVREKAALRELIDLGTNLAGNAFDTKGRASTDLVAVASHTLAGMSAAGARGGLQPAKIAMKLQFAEMSERYNLGGDKLIGLPTPWAAVNRLTKGLRKGVLYVLGGRPSMGKSILGVQIAAFNALRGVRAALFSVEMTAQECLARAAAACGDIPHDWIDQPSDCADSEIYWSRYTAITQALIASPLLIDDTAGLTVEQFLARARREHMRKPIELLIGDHIHDFAIDGKREARHEYGRIAQAFKTLAKEFNCPAVALAQLSRGSAQRSDKRPSLTDLRESGEIEQKGDVILFVHREDYYDKRDNCPWKGLIELIPAKGRNIKTGDSIILTNEYGYMRAGDYDGPRPQDSMQEMPRRSGRTTPMREIA